MEKTGNVRHFMQPFIGRSVMDITQSEKGDPEEEVAGSFIQLFFDNGTTLRFFVRDDGPAFAVDHLDTCTCDLCLEEESDDPSN
jgi:hypothetical protein